MTERALIATLRFALATGEPKRVLRCWEELALRVPALLAVAPNLQVDPFGALASQDEDAPPAAARAEQSRRASSAANNAPAAAMAHAPRAIDFGSRARPAQQHGRPSAADDGRLDHSHHSRSSDPADAAGASVSNRPKNVDQRSLAQPSPGHALAHRAAQVDPATGRSNSLGQAARARSQAVETGQPSGSTVAPNQHQSTQDAFQNHALDPAVIAHFADQIRAVAEPLPAAHAGGALAQPHSTTRAALAGGLDDTARASSSVHRSLPLIASDHSSAEWTAPLAAVAADGGLLAALSDAVLGRERRAASPDRPAPSNRPPAWDPRRSDQKQAPEAPEHPTTSPVGDYPVPVSDGYARADTGLPTTIIKGHTQGARQILPGRPDATVSTAAERAALQRPPRSLAELATAFETATASAPQISSAPAASQGAEVVPAPALHNDEQGVALAAAVSAPFASDLDADELADLINEALVEQAERHGVDCS